MNLHKQNFVCWPSVGPQDIKQTYIHTYIPFHAEPATPRTRAPLPHKMALDTLKRARPDESSDKAAASDDEAEEYVAGLSCPFLRVAAVHVAV